MRRCAAALQVLAGEGRIWVEINFEWWFPMWILEGSVDLIHHWQLGQWTAQCSSSYYQKRACHSKAILSYYHIPLLGKYVPTKFSLSPCLAFRNEEKSDWEAKKSWYLMSQLLFSSIKIKPFLILISWVWEDDDTMLKTTTGNEANYVF